MNVFNTEVHKQFYIDGVQEENRDSLPMRYVSDIQTDNAEYLYNRFGSDLVAQNSTDSTYTTPAFTYSADEKLINLEAISADRITEKEMSRQGFDITADRKDKHAHAIKQAVHRHATRTTRLGAGGIVDNEVLGGTASALTPITLSVSNPDDISATVVQVLQEGNAFSGRNPYVMMSPRAAKFFSARRSRPWSRCRNYYRKPSSSIQRWNWSRFSIHRVLNSRPSNPNHSRCTGSKANSSYPRSRSVLNSYSCRIRFKLFMGNCSRTHAFRFLQLNYYCTSSSWSNSKRERSTIVQRYRANVRTTARCSNLDKRRSKDCKYSNSSVVTNETPLGVLSRVFRSMPSTKSLILYDNKHRTNTHRRS